MGLTNGCLQGAYGVVRLAYNESEDRHYVSLGLGRGVAQAGPRSLGSRQECGGKAVSYWGGSYSWGVLRD